MNRCFQNVSGSLVGHGQKKLAGDSVNRGVEQGVSVTGPDKRISFFQNKNANLWRLAFRLLLNSLVARGGIEPPTQGFSILCSTN
jgi:hypothetical protein